jgi:hypothetical protein
MGQLSAAEQNRENQAARIRWLLARADMLTYLEFTTVYAAEHPFVSEEEEVIEDARDRG